MVYIDGSHVYLDALQDIIKCTPKVKPGGIVAGHDYHPAWPGVVYAVKDVFGQPDLVYPDGTWVKRKREKEKDSGLPSN